MVESSAVQASARAFDARDYPPRTAPIDTEVLGVALEIAEGCPELVHRTMKGKLVDVLRRRLDWLSREEAWDTVSYLFASIAAGTIEPDYRLHQPEFQVARRGQEPEGARYYVLDYGTNPLHRQALAALAVVTPDRELADKILAELARVEKAGDERG